MAGKEESLSLKPCGGARRGAEEKEDDALKPCSHRGGSKNLDGFSLKPCTTTSTPAAVAFAGNEIQFKQGTTQGILCSTKRKVPTGGHDDEDTAPADSVTTEQAIKVSGADSEVDSSDDDHEPVSEAEFGAFYEEKAKHERFYIERVLPLELKNASVLQRQCKAESVL